MGLHWYTNGEKDIYLNDDDEIPNGFHLGRKQRSIESRQKQSASMMGHEGYWTNKKMPPDSRGETLRKQFQSGEKVQWNKGLSGDPRCKGHRLGTPTWNKGLTAETDERVAKYLSGWKDGTLQRKQYNTKKQNNSFHISNQEDKYYEELCLKYGIEDVERQYSDDRYPFSCDFYIKSKDLFIEFNRSWTHGGHPFNETSLDDISKLEEWQEKAKTSKYYQNAIYTWIDLDVRKQKVAKENRLNYKMIY